MLRNIQGKGLGIMERPTFYGPQPSQMSHVSPPGNVEIYEAEPLKRWTQTVRQVSLLKLKQQLEDMIRAEDDTWSVQADC
jgi:hypothetical protein